MIHVHSDTRKLQVVRKYHDYMFLEPDRSKLLELMSPNVSIRIQANGMDQFYNKDDFGDFIEKGYYKRVTAVYVSKLEYEINDDQIYCYLVANELRSAPMGYGTYQISHSEIFSVNRDMEIIGVEIICGPSKLLE